MTTANMKRIIDIATEVFGTEERALDWTEKMSGTLGSTPAVLSETDEGTNAVLLHLANIARNSVFDL